MYGSRNNKITLPCTDRDIKSKEPPGVIKILKFQDEPMKSILNIIIAALRVLPEVIKMSIKLYKDDKSSMDSMNNMLKSTRNQKRSSHD